MKVTCKKCGKLFDYDTYMGICPGCAKYYSMSCSCNNDLEREMFREKSSKSVVKEYGKKKSDNKHKYYDKKPGLVKGIVLFVVICNIGIPLIGGLFSFISDISDSDMISFEETLVDFIDENTEDEYIEDDYSDRIIKYDCEGVGWIVDICSAEYETQLFDVMQEGYEMISIPYYIYCDEYETTDIPEKISQITTPSLMLQDGSCIYPESKETIGDLLQIEEEDYSSCGISDNFSLDYGRMYFCVKEGEAQALVIDVINDNDMSETYYIESIFE